MANDKQQTRGHIEREARALAACDGKEFWASVPETDRAKYRQEAREIAEAGHERGEA